MTYTVYKTTNAVTNRYYIGVHKTDDENDGYLGSGLVLKRAVKKYGRGSFKKEVLFAYPTQAEALFKEAEIVESCKLDPLCYNLHEGGFGGFENINERGLNNKNDNHRSATEARLLKIATDPEFRAKMVAAAKKGYEKAKQNPAFYNAYQRLDEARDLAVKAWTGKKHSPKTRLKMSEERTGEKNSRFGCRWMHHPSLGNKSVIPDEIEAHTLAGWVFGRKR